MSYVTQEQFDTLHEYRYDASEHEPNSCPDTAKAHLLAHWEHFVRMLNTRWFGNVSKDDIYELLSSDRSPGGSVAVSACFSALRDNSHLPKILPGGVCSITIKSEKGLRTYDAVAQRDGFQCWPINETWRDRMCYPTPKQLLDGICDRVFGTNKWTLLEKPSGLTQQSAFGVERVLQDVRTTDALSWRAALSEDDVRGIERELMSLTSREPGFIPAALFENDKNVAGHLYQLVTCHGARYTITFHSAGYTMFANTGVVARFQSLSDMLAYTKTALFLNVVPRPASWRCVSPEVSPVV